MAIFIGVLLALLSVGVVLYPFLKPGTFFRQPPPTPESSPDEPDLESIFDAIQTLQLEYQLGNVPQGLYREQLIDYRMRAALALRQQAESSGQDAEQTLEQEIMLARASLAHANGQTTTCPNCGATFGIGLAQCPECIVELGLSGRGATQE